MTMVKANLNPVSDLNAAQARLNIVCPACYSPLPALEEWSSDSLHCPGCGATYARFNDIYRFVSSEYYTGTFGYQWNKPNPHYFGEAARKATEDSLRKLHITPELVKGRLVLDAGCGMGRFSEVLSRWGANVVAVDLSEAVEAARSNLRDRANVKVLQADLTKLPFPPATFDIVLSWGVLHHTPNTHQSFKALVRYLRPGGRMGIKVYGKNKSIRRKMWATWRRITTRMPKRLLFALCHLAGPLFYVYKIPLLGPILRNLFPISHQPRTSERIIETFDEYAPQYSWRHAFPEVHAWFVDAGFQDIRIYDPPIYATGVLAPGREN